jgi:hypothetical protein
MSKPPWFQFIDLARSWSEKTLLIDGFLLESSPWHTLNLGFNPPHSPHKLQWFQFLQSAAHADESNRKEVVDLFLYNLYQTWHFTEILAAETYRVIISRQYKPNALVALILCKLLVTGYTFQLEGTYAQLDLKEGNLTHGHCQLLKYAIGFMALASQMASEIIQSGWLIAQLNLWLLWTNMSAYQLFMLEWLLSSYKENVELILVASIKESVNWVWALLLIFVCTPSKKVQQSLMVIQVLVLHAGC